MAMLARMLSPKELSNLSDSHYQILRGQIEAELLNNQDIKKILEGRVKDTHKAIQPAKPK